MTISFYKYQGAGNDFIIIDNRTKIFPKDTTLIKRLCNRRFGIGADGLLLLEDDQKSDFRMIYFNSDGNESTMCGNGGRCIVAFAKRLRIIKNETKFVAKDGFHRATIEDEIVKLEMTNVKSILVKEKYCFLNTGSPHHVELVKDLSNFDVVTHGRKIRNEVYGSEGSNVNFVEQINENSFKLRTYERGVEDETLACGTGATAVAIAMHKIGNTQDNSINLNVKGGNLRVNFTVNNNNYKNIQLIGKAEFVFTGIINL